MNKIITTILLSLSLLSCTHNTIKKDTHYPFAHINSTWQAVKSLDSRSYESYPPKKSVQLYNNKDSVFVLEKSLNNLKELLDNKNLQLYCHSKKQTASKWQNDFLMVQCNNQTWKKAKINKIVFSKKDITNKENK